MKKFKVSVITCVLNAEDTIERTIKSVLSQSYPSIEYLVIDGGSTDGTLNVIESYEDEIDYWISEPDNGIYHAMNKGAKVATGDYLYFLNADDWLVGETVIESVFQEIKGEQPSLIYGNTIRVYPGFEVVISRKFRKTLLKRGEVPSHQASFISRNSFWELDGYEEQYRSAGDFDLFCRMYEEGFSSSHINRTIANVSSGGLSSRKNVSVPEVYRVIIEHFGYLPAVTYWLNKTIIENGVKKLLLAFGMNSVYKKLLRYKMNKE